MIFTLFSPSLTGAIYAESSEVFIHGDTVFVDNSAEENGGEGLSFTRDVAPNCIFFKPSLSPKKRRVR